MSPAAARRLVRIRPGTNGQYLALPSTTPVALRPCARQLYSVRRGRAASPTIGRPFHSFDHPNEPPPQDRFSDAEQAILTAAARHISTHGFTERTIALGTYDAGYPAISTNILPEGIFSLVRWHLVNQRTGLAARSLHVLGEMPLDDTVLAPTEVASRAERIIWERLLGNKDVVGRWQEVRT
jgi:ubiquinone biosynthesis protein COQ9